MAPGTSRQIRLDCLMVERGIVESQHKAQALVLAGKVLVNEQKITKPGVQVDRNSALRTLARECRYASRGGLKLEGALQHFHSNVTGAVCLDIGASTGGFTDCLLQHGASRVYAVDAGTNQLDWRLRQDPRVVVREKTNARYLRPEQIGEPVDLVTVDVSFISAALILPVLPPTLKSPGEIFVLVKPQFEARRELVGKGGIVGDPLVRQQAVEKVRSKAEQLGFKEIEPVESSLPGAEGNLEFFLHALWLKSV